MKAELLNRFKTITSTEEKQLHDHIFHRKITDKKLVNNATENLTVLTDTFFRSNITYIAKHPRFATYPLHTHTFYVINYILSGKITQMVNGKIVHLHQGDLLLLNIGTTHQVLAPDDNDLMINLSFHPNAFDVFAKKSNEPYFLYRSNDNNEKIRNILEIIIEEYFYQNEYSKENITDLIKVLNRLLKFNVHIINFSANKSDEALTQKMLYEITEHYTDTSLKEIAQKYSYNPSYLGTVFKKNVGLSFHQVLLDKRLTVAYHQLLFTSYTVDKISENVGFTRKTTFYKAFEEKYQATPKQIRDQQKKKIKYI